MKLLLILIALILGPSAAAAEPLPPSLARAVDVYNRATVAKDIRALSGLVTNDYLLVNSDASVQDKASYLADFRVPNFTINPYKVEQLVCKVHANSALTSWVMRLSWNQDGKHQSRRLRIVHSWVRLQGQWQIEYTQLTRVPD